MLAWVGPCFCNAVLTSFLHVVSLRKRELVALYLCSCCCVTFRVLCLFLTVPWKGLFYEIVEFLSHTHLLSNNKQGMCRSCTMVCLHVCGIVREIKPVDYLHYRWTHHDISFVCNYSCWHFNMYEQDVFHAFELNMKEGLQPQGQAH